MHPVFPVSKCKLRLLKLERIKDYLLMEEEFIRNQEVLKPREEQNEVPVPCARCLCLFSDRRCGVEREGES